MKELHPQLTLATKAVYDSKEVQDAIKTLGRFGLGVFLPHKHNENHEMVPLGDDEVQLEDNLMINFVSTETIQDNAFIPVGWSTDDHGNIRTFARCCRSPIL